MQDCVYRDPTTRKWKDVYCDEMHTAVCQLEPVSGKDFDYDITKTCPCNIHIFLAGVKIENLLSDEKFG